jgi:hypothetical protein
MSEMEGSKEIKKVFETILGVPVVIEQDEIDVMKSIFTLIIEEIEILNNNEHAIFENTKIDLSSITDGYLSVIEKLFMLNFGEQAYDVIIWYLFHRVAPDGTIVKLENQQGESFEINTPEQLWDFITTKLPNR